jgi:Uma2 family endonuclease
MSDSPAGWRTFRDAPLLSQRRAEHIMVMPAGQHRWTAREVRDLIAKNPLASPRYELVDGELLVTPSPNESHQGAVGLLLARLIEYLERHPIGRAYTSPFDVELEPNTIVQPDVFVVPMREVQRMRGNPPARELLVAAEVLSPSSIRYDLGKKRELYQRWVPEYWIVDVDARRFERRRQGSDQTELLVDTLEWRPADAREAFVLDLPRYFTAVLDLP